MNRRTAAIFIVFALACLPVLVHAAASVVLVSPAVIDLKGKQRDILKDVIRITNTTDHVVSLYPRVDDVDKTDGVTSFNPANDAAGMAASLANWIELSRGVIELTPGEEREVPFTVRVDPGAAAGTYHAAISFSTGGTRDEAEKGEPVASVTVNLDVQADIKEIMQINRFSTDNVVFTGDDVIFKYQVQNIGNQDEKPAGEIRIYDRTGHEVASVGVNREGKTVAPDQISQLASVWSAVQGFGKFKAMLTVKYGASQKASVQDVVYLWVIPWKQLATMLSIAIVTIIVLALYLHRWLEERHFTKLAHQGLLKAEAVMPQRAPAPSSIPANETLPKKRWFSREKKEQAAPLQAVMPQKRELRSLREALPQSSVRSQKPGGTIDLKKMGVRHAQEWRVENRNGESQHGSVINLKNHT